MGTKRSVLVDEKGLPLAVVLSGANTHDVKLLEETLDHIVVLHPESDEEHPQNLCLDAGYTGSAEKVQKHGYTPHIRPRGEEKKELERNPEFRTRRWVVEVTHSFFNRSDLKMAAVATQSFFYTAMHLGYPPSDQRIAPIFSSFERLPIQDRSGHGISTRYDARRICRCGSR